MSGRDLVGEKAGEPYLADNSDRPENIGKSKRETDRKKEQDRINEEENRPLIIKAILSFKNNKKKKAALQSMPFDKLIEHHSQTEADTHPKPIIEEE